MTKPRDSISIELLKALIRLEPETGKLFWLHRPMNLFDSERIFLAWNTKCAGKEALINISDQGYLNGAIFGRHYRAHRVVWALHYGEWPDKIDHINGNRADNRISNLRSVIDIENSHNHKISKRNKSGFSGVCWDKKSSKWQAYIANNYKIYRLGSFTEKEEAIAVRKKAIIHHNFHSNHGRPA